MSSRSSKSPRERISRVVRDIPRSGIRDFFDIVSQRHDIISLGVGEPDFDTPWHVREATIYALEKGVTSYTSNRGLPKLRQALARYVEAQFGVAYDPDLEMLVTVGVSEALDLAVRAVINPGDEVLYHSPCYVSYAPVILFAGGVPVAVETRAEDGFRLTREALERKVTPRTRLLMLNFPNNPTGATLTPDDVRELAAFAEAHDLVVVTDEIYAELTYEGRHVSIAAEPGMKERTIFLHGFSKAWAMTGFRLGYACAPPDLTEAMMKIHQYVMLCAPILSQEAALEALRDPERDIGPMRDEYRRRRNYFVKALNDAGVPCHRPGGAFYLFPEIRSLGLSSKDFALRLLEEESVAAVPGTAFGPEGEGFLRCAYATGFAEIREAAGRIARFADRLRRT